MARRRFSKGTRIGLVAAGLLLLATPAWAGVQLTGKPKSPVPPPPVASARTVPAAVVLVVTFTPEPAKEEVFINVRGPDGQVRRFAVEGSLAAVQTQPVVVRPGQSVTITYAAAK